MLQSANVTALTSSAQRPGHSINLSIVGPLTIRGISIAARTKPHYGKTGIARQPCVVVGVSAMTSSSSPKTSPKKSSLMPSGKLRRALRAHGHALSPTVQIGKAGVTDGVIGSLAQALADHELVKLKVGGESPADRFEVAARLAEEPGVNIVQVLGRTILLYKRHPHAPRFEGKRAAAKAAQEKAPAKKQTTRKSAPK
jgi:RNA-binding protein